MKVQKGIKSLIVNARGSLVFQKLVIIESDDWGAIRTSDKSALELLRKMNLNVDSCHYTKYDSLASSNDLEALMEVLSKVKNREGRSPILTANTIIGNPDFERIRQSDFMNYYWQDFRKSLQEYPNHNSSFSLWREAENLGIFYPQFHGREHINVSRWMTALQEGDEVTTKAFDLGICSLSAHILPRARGSHLAAFDGGDIELKYDRAEIVREGLHAFRDIFGYASQSMIAPNYVWDDNIEEAAQKEGVKFIQSSTVQRISKDFQDRRLIKRHFTGQKNKLGQSYLVRNCHFEPSSNPNKDWLDSCLSEIKMAFNMRKPAIISTHRVNYIGFIDPKNRDRNLPKLEFLLETIVQKWPDVVFMSSDQLGNHITNSN